MAGKFGMFLPVPNQEADAAMQEVRNTFSNDLAGMLANIKSEVNQSLTSEREKLLVDRQLLEAITLIGLNPAHPGVGRWIELIRSDHLTADLTNIVEQALSQNARSISDLRSTVETSRKKLLSGLDDLKIYDDLQAPAMAISEQIKQMISIKNGRAWMMTSAHN